MNPILSNLHTHTTWSDGSNVAEEYVQAALEKGWVSLGFSEHSYTPYDSDCCVKRENVSRYFEEICLLKRKYAGRIELYLGLEGDYYHPTPRDEVDYWIGSAHYLRDGITGRYYTVDYLPEILEDAARTVAGGSMRGLVEQYYRLLMDLVTHQKPDIVGHPDLITKLNRDNRYFDTGSPWYDAATSALTEAIAQAGCMVEVNTGGMFRGYTLEPYPSESILRKLHGLGVPVTISSDAHSVEGLDYGFEEAAELLFRVGYNSIRRLEGGVFRDVPL